MGLFRRFCSSIRNIGTTRYRTEEAFRQNLARQLKATPLSIAQFQQYGVTEDKSFKLEFTFYTNVERKGRALARSLKRLRYDAVVREVKNDSGRFLITGWTTPINMSPASVLAWTEKMCRLGYELDCEFDGWGTFHNQ